MLSSFFYLEEYYIQSPSAVDGNRCFDMNGKYLWANIACWHL